MQARYEKLSDLRAQDSSLCPEGKLTREIAHDPRYGMPVRMIVLEEFQEYYELGDDRSKEIASLLVTLSKAAPGAGIILLDSTQKPSGVGSGDVATRFTSFRDQHGVRFGLRTTSGIVSEACLGQGTRAEGLDTSKLLKTHKGVGILHGASDETPTVRCHYADGTDAEHILKAAREIRRRAGTLSGMAAGQTVAIEARDVLGDVLAVFGSERGLHWEVLAERLTMQFPDHWKSSTKDAVSDQVRGLGVPSVDVKMSKVTLKGCRRDAVERAVRS